MKKSEDILEVVITSENRTALESSKSAFADLSKSFQQLGVVLQKSIKQLPESLLTLSTSGWYISWNTSPANIHYYAEQIALGNQKNIDDAIIHDLELEIDQIEATLIKNFPHRANVLVAAIKAHKERNYYLSVPVFISQTEGISKEITGYRFYSQKQSKPVISAWVSNFPEDTFTRLLLEPLNIINESRQGQDFSNPNGLNRHDILHGDCFDYGEDRVNSFKALSQLLFLGEVVFTLKKDLNKP